MSYVKQILLSNIVRSPLIYIVKKIDIINLLNKKKYKDVLIWYLDGSFILTISNKN